jgi:hypothetical protein
MEDPTRRVTVLVALLLCFPAADSSTRARGWRSTLAKLARSTEAFLETLDEGVTWAGGRVCGCAVEELKRPCRCEMQAVIAEGTRAKAAKPWSCRSPVPEGLDPAQRREGREVTGAASCFCATLEKAGAAGLKGK